MSAQPELHNRMAEEALLGGLLLNANRYWDIANGLTGSDFHLLRHQVIWNALVSLIEKGQEVDFVTITEELERRGKLEEVGGPAFLSGLLTATVSSLHVLDYAQIIKKHSLQRQLLDAASKVATLAHKDDLDPEDMLAQAEQALTRVSNNLVSENMQSFKEVLSRVYDQMYTAANQKTPPGVPTGFLDLDKLLGGLQPGDVVIVAARPGMGKTSLLCGISEHIARLERKRVVFFSLEMSSDHVVQRILAMHTGISAQVLRTGHLTDDQWKHVHGVMELLEDAPIILNDTPTLTPAQLRIHLRRLASRQKIDLVIVDYLQLMSGGSKFYNRQEEVTAISRQIKVIAKELGVPVIVAAQLSRAVEARDNKMPVLSDLRESGAIEQDADVVLFIHQTQNGSPGAGSLIVAKNRNGPVGHVPVTFIAARTKFVAVNAPEIQP